MVEVIGVRGPAAGQRIVVPDADLAAAIDPDAGWAVEILEGVATFYDPYAPYDPEWKVPGYYIPPELTDNTRPPEPEPKPPSVLGVAPPTGPIEGGTAVVITGTNLTGATAVQFGSKAATSFTVANDTTINAVTPSVLIAGDVDVTVTTGEGSNTAPAAFEYVAA